MIALNTIYPICYSNFIAGDSLSYSNNSKFSTPDQDNDGNSNSCANWYRTAGWFISCFWANPNGPYTDSEQTASHGYVAWYHFKQLWISLKTMKLMIRPKEWHRDVTSDREILTTWLNKWTNLSSISIFFKQLITMYSLNVLIIKIIFNRWCNCMKIVNHLYVNRILFCFTRIIKQKLYTRIV